MLGRIRVIIRKFDHILLLAGLLFLIASPIWETLIGGGVLLSDFMILVTLVAGLSVTYTHKNHRIGLVQIIGLVVILMTALDLFINLGSGFENITHVTQIVYYLILTATMFKLIVRARQVDAEVLINSISGYLLMGLSWSILVVVWSAYHPSSFSFEMVGENALFESMYYSFVTMTTLGYGDMLPTSLAAKSFSMLISITGAFYTTIVLGMIVGKYISNQSLNNK